MDKKNVKEALAERRQRLINQHKDLLGMEITQARAALGYWWVLSDQFVVPGGVSTYTFRRAGTGVLRLHVENNIVKKIS